MSEVLGVAVARTFPPSEVQKQAAERLGALSFVMRLLGDMPTRLGDGKMRRLWEALETAHRAASNEIGPASWEGSRPTPVAVVDALYFSGLAQNTPIRKAATASVGQGDDGAFVQVSIPGIGGTAIPVWEAELLIRDLVAATEAAREIGHKGQLIQVSETHAQQSP